jgi:hypothetical protein
VMTYTSLRTVDSVETTYRAVMRMGPLHTVSGVSSAARLSKGTMECPLLPDVLFSGSTR